MDSIKTDRTRLLIPAVCALLAVVTTSRFILEALPDYLNYGDLPQYMASVRMIMEGQGADIYRPPYLGPMEEKLFPGLMRHVVIFVPPLALPVLMPIGLLPDSCPECLFTLIEALAVAGGVFALARAFRFSLYSTLWWLGLLALSAPVYETIRIGALSGFVFLFFALSLMFLRENRTVPAGLFLSFMLLVPQIAVPFLVFLAGAKKRKLLAWVFLFLLMLFAVSLLLIGPDGYAAYITFFEEVILKNELGSRVDITTTLRGQLTRLFPGNYGTIFGVASAVWAVFFAWLFVAARRLRRSADLRSEHVASGDATDSASGDAAECASGTSRKAEFNGGWIGGSWIVPAVMISMPFGLLFSPYIQIYDTLLIVPSLMALQASGLLARLPDWVKILFLPAMALFHSSPYSAIHYYYLLHGGVINPFFVTLLIISIFLIWLVISYSRNMAASARPSL